MAQDNHELMTPPDISHIVTEDDTPVDSVFAEKQARLLTEPLYTSWAGPESGMFWAASNVGLFYQISEPPIVPDMMLSLNVKPGDFGIPKERRSYFTFAYGKPPDVVIEFVSNTEGNENGSKLKTYAKASASYYVIYDPEMIILRQPLRIMYLHANKYVDNGSQFLDGVGLGLTIWNGEFESMQAPWLRWTDASGVLIPTGSERAVREEQRAEQAEQRVEQAEQRAAKLSAMLRELGKNPDA